MKLFAVCVFSFFFVAGCGSPVVPSTSESTDSPNVTVSESDEGQEQEAQTSDMETEVSLYQGEWFDIEYPSSFFASPQTPKEIFDGVEFVKTDEAFFLSPDGSVEFFVFSPRMGGDPSEYLKTAAHEVLGDTNTQQTGDGIEKTVTYSGTFQAKDHSYQRSFLSVKKSIDEGVEFHHVFGIKYRNQEMYEKYKQDYIAFKKSLEQYAD